FLPYLAGERTPHNDPFASGVFMGLRHETTRAHFAYAVLEGVAFGLADGLAALRAAGTEVGRLSLLGGGSRSALWAQLIADALGVPCDVLDGAQAGAALGAARLGWIAAGGTLAQVCQRPPVRQAFEPDAARHHALQGRLQRFREIYSQTGARI
ncbi:MAG TPA: FGGY-family carbohydrate kinase, partial [Burkholderiaceae bacterium]